jgi:hypothetical protein
VWLHRPGSQWLFVEVSRGLVLVKGLPCCTVNVSTKVLYQVVFKLGEHSNGMQLNGSHFEVHYYIYFLPNFFVGGGCYRYNIHVNLHT